MHTKMGSLLFIIGGSGFSIRRQMERLTKGMLTSSINVRKCPVNGLDYYGALRKGKAF